MLIIAIAASGAAQVPTSVLIKIVKVEDSLTFDQTLVNLIKDRNPAIIERAALAAGRIGDDDAIPALSELMAEGRPINIRAMAAFALGEIESIKSAELILKALNDPSIAAPIRARAVEAAGKIASANAKDPKSKELGNAIISTLEREHAKAARFDRETVLLGLTALLRVRTEGSDVTAAHFLTSPDARVRADAGNTMTRIKAKNANITLRKMLASDSDPTARANAARALGAAEDKKSLGILLSSATADPDARVRVAAIRSIAALKDPNAAEKMLKRGEELLAVYTKAKRPNFIPSEQNEFTEIAVALGRLLANTNNERADKLFADFGKLDKGHTPEVYIARVQIGPKRADGEAPEVTDWRQYSTLAQIVGEIASIEPTGEAGKQMKAEAPGIIRPLARAFAEADPASEGKRMYAGPDTLQAFARFKTDDLGEVARLGLQNKDVQMRAAAAGILADLPSSDENTNALRVALDRALKFDKQENDAQLAILDALVKLAGRGSISEVSEAIHAPDYLVRKKALELLQQFPGWSDTPVVGTAKVKMLTVQPYDPNTGTKLGQVLNMDADYHRAVTRRNGSVKAILTTGKGSFTIVFNPEEAPLTVDNFVKLARSGYFNGLEVHRVVPNFVMQDGDPRGDGNGGPGWSIRCEVNMLPYNRGAVGMALSGKDTGGSQWFVTHSPQPHLDGGYTVFGQVNETDMKVVDNIVRGDKILSVAISENTSPKPRPRTRKK